jgi:RNA polymerase sigma-70 factor (ECF subfamily)
VTFGQISRSADTVIQSNLDAAYRLARWHFSDEREAESIVEAAALRACRQFVDCPDTAARVWFLRIVSEACAERRRQTARIESVRHDVRDSAPPPVRVEDFLDGGDASGIEAAIRSLPFDLREVIVLRDLEGLSYREVSAVMQVPVDAIAISVSHGRQALARALAGSLVAG